MILSTATEKYCPAFPMFSHTTSQTQYLKFKIRISQKNILPPFHLYIITFFSPDFWSERRNLGLKFFKKKANQKSHMMMRFWAHRCFLRRNYIKNLSAWILKCMHKVRAVQTQFPIQLQLMQGNCWRRVSAQPEVLTNDLTSWLFFIFVMVQGKNNVVILPVRTPETIQINESMTKLFCWLQHLCFEVLSEHLK